MFGLHILLSVWFAWCLVLVSGKLVHVTFADLGWEEMKHKHNLHSG